MSKYSMVPQKRSNAALSEDASSAASVGLLHMISRRLEPSWPGAAAPLVALLWEAFLAGVRKDLTRSRLVALRRTLGVYWMWRLGPLRLTSVICVCVVCEWGGTSYCDHVFFVCVFHFLFFMCVRQKAIIRCSNVLSHTCTNGTVAQNS